LVSHRAEDGKLVETHPDSLFVCYFNSSDKTEFVEKCEGNPKPLCPVAVLNDLSVEVQIVEVVADSSTSSCKCQERHAARHVPMYTPLCLADLMILVVVPKLVFTHKRRGGRDLFCENLQRRRAF